MVKKILLTLLPLLFLLGSLPGAWGQVCAPTPNSGANFQVYEPGSSQPLQVLCVGKTVRLKDASGRQLDPAQIYYFKGPSISCNFTDTSTFYTPTAPGVLVITQNTQNPQPGGSGIIFSRNFDVKAVPPPTFTTTVCTPGFVQVSITDTNYDLYTVQVGSGAPVPAVRTATVTYPTAGPATITVAGRYNGGATCVGTATQPYTPKAPPVAPAIQRLTVQAGNSLEVQFGALLAGYQYSLQVADAAATGGYRTVAPLSAGGTSFTLSGAALPGCYRLLLQDVCQPAVVALPSAEVCTVSLTAASLNGRNQLRWTTSQPGPFTITRGGTALVQLPTGTTQYEDTAVTCGTAYTYRVTAGTGTTVSLSNEAAVTTTSGLAPAAPRLLASFNLRNQVELTAIVPRSPTGGQLTFLRNGAAIGTTAARALRDSVATPSPGAALCYSARFLDACGNISADAAPVCPVLLTATAANDEGTTIRLDWTPLQGPATTPAPTYRVLTLAPDNAVLAATPVASGLTYLDLSPPQDQQTVRYRIEATGAGLTAPSYSNVASVTRLVKLFVPTAFSPNGDGLNDVLELKGRFLDNFRFTIMDRNGQQVFQSTSRAQRWDGRVGNEKPVLGAYVWRYEATDSAGKRVVQHGTVTIVR